MTMERLRASFSVTFALKTFLLALISTAHAFIRMAASRMRLKLNLESILAQRGYTVIISSLG